VLVDDFMERILLAVVDDLGDNPAMALFGTDILGSCAKMAD
jgi:hypothetical protein